MTLAELSEWFEAVGIVALRVSRFDGQWAARATTADGAIGAATNDDVGEAIARAVELAADAASGKGQHG